MGHSEMLKQAVIFRQGNSICLRPPEEKDLEMMTVWINDYRITRNLLAYLPTSKAKEREFLEGTGKDNRNIALAIVGREDDNILGMIGLHHIDWKNRDATFGIFIGDENSRKKGYGKEATNLLLEYAFQTLDLERISSSCWDFNIASQALHKSCGFIREGIKRRAGYIEGKRCDSILFGILKEEWRALYNNQ
jgi:RimJ/RimL family protein N-acetyltransferase